MDTEITEYVPLSEGDIIKCLTFVKARLKMVYDAEDEALKQMIINSHRDIGSKINNYDIEDERIFELVCERTKYTYEDVLEYFEQSFHGNLWSLSREFGGIY